jgi:hypothetical protein
MVGIWANQATRHMFFILKKLGWTAFHLSYLQIKSFKGSITWALKKMGQSNWLGFPDLITSG